MKKIATLILFWFFLKLSAGNLDAYLYLTQFNSQELGPYLECYLNISGQTVSYKLIKNGSYQANLEVLYLFKQSDTIRAFEKYQLNSPIVRDSLSKLPNFTDVQRILLPNGTYNFEVQIKDLNDSSKYFNYQSIISINFSKEHQFSDIEMVESYQPTQKVNKLTKGNIDIIPYVSTFYPNNIKKLNFYVELYNKKENEDLLLHYYIESAKNTKPINSFSVYTRLKSKAVNPFLKGFNINTLATGNYNLVLALKNRENQLLIKKKFFFQRINYDFQEPIDTVEFNNFVLPELAQIKSTAKMKDYIKCAYPIYSQKEIAKARNALSTEDIDILKAFFNQFWKTFSSNPQEDWIVYKNNVQLVNRSFTSQIRKGYETDRGRVYLQYGTPNSIKRSTHEPSSYPYEIWHYFELNGETDIQFIFYNPDLSGNDYRLLHSDLTGETNNPYWERDLTKRNSTSPLDFDNRKGEKQYGNRGKQIYNR